MYVSVCVNTCNHRNYYPGGALQPPEAGLSLMTPRWGRTTRREVYPSNPRCRTTPPAQRAPLTLPPHRPAGGALPLTEKAPQPGSCPFKEEGARCWGAGVRSVRFARPPARLCRDVPPAAPGPAAAVRTAPQPSARSCLRPPWQRAAPRSPSSRATAAVLRSAARRRRQPR